MYFHFLNLNRYKITGLILSVFLVVSVLNWVSGPIVLTYAEGEMSPTTEFVAETAINTGDAVSQTGIQNEVNTNIINTETQNLNQEGNQNGSTNLIVQDQNQADVVNSSNTSASTGNNSALAENSGSSINTGNATANTDVVNLVNTNLINSDGSIIVGSDSMGNSSLDLRENFSSSGGGCEGCLKDVSVSNQNSASVVNNVNVTANTGDNIASGEISSITTGDAYASANVVNIVNTNIVKSNYMLLVFNNFGNWSGDLIFPNSDFFRDFFSRIFTGCLACGNVNIDNNNSASILNSVQTLSNSGGNFASDGSVITGNSAASSNVYNQINTSVYGGSSFYLKIKVFGDWTGNIFNLPENILWGKTSDGLVLYDKNGSDPFADRQFISSGNSDLSVSNSNSANVSNNINVSANTGDNSASGENTSVKTGNAYAASNQMNIVNTNVISSNWTAALINVFGNWSGNVSFGQPNLWIGTVAETDKTITSGSIIRFTTTIKNNGDALASDIKVKAESKSQYLEISGGGEWSINPLPPGQSVTISYVGTVVGDLPPGHNNLINQTSVLAKETDGDLKDNVDTVTLPVYVEGSIFLPYNSRFSSYPNLAVTKTHTIKDGVSLNGQEMMVAFGGSVDYKVIVRNNGGLAFEGVLFDQLKDQNGTVISQQSWNLGEIQSNEEIILTYTTQFTDNSVPGIYTNYAWVEALGGDYSFDPNLAFASNSNIASDRIILAEKATMQIDGTEPTGEVLGVSDQNLSVEKTTESEFLNGFCVDKKSNNPKLGVVQSVILGLSFILIMQRRKKIPSNLFLM